MLRWSLWALFLPLTLPVRLLRALVARLLRCNTLELQLGAATTDFGRDLGLFGGRVTPLSTVYAALASAEADPDLRRVVVRIDGFRGGLARAEELRVALERVRGAGKDVIVVADHLDLTGYWIALGALRIHPSPTGSLDVTGVASEFTLWKGLLDKAGVRARLAARGKYKSMREAFAADEMSAANREMLRSLVEDLYRQLEERISGARALPREALRALVDQGPFRASEAHRLGLLDAPCYPDELRDQWTAQGSVRALGPVPYLRRRQRRWLPSAPPRVALLEVEGSIRMGDDGFGPLRKRATGARTFARACERLRKDKRVAAILLRVDSPGGSALASDLMWHALGRAKQGRPLFVSMANVAASGGYYVSAVKDARVFASACTVTGSIGVVGGKFELSKLQQQLGIGKEIIAVGKHASFHSPSADFSDEEFEKLERDIDALYTDFVTKVAEGRARDFDAIDRVAQGRVWTGAQARGHGLVDEVGGLRDALDALRQELGVPPGSPLALVVPDRPSFVERVRTTFGRSEASAWERLMPADVAAAFRGEHAREVVSLRLPFDVRFF